MNPAMSEPKGRDPALPLGTVTVLGAHILDVLGRPVGEIPPGQGSVRLKEIRATAAGTAAGTGVDLAKLGARVRAVGALGDDLLGDIVIAAMARHGVDTAGLIRKKEAQTSATILPIRPNGERPAFHVPGATRLFTRADVDLDAIQDSRALLIGAPDALAGLTGGDLADIAEAARSNGVLVAVDVLYPGRPEDLDRLAPLLAMTDWFVPNADQLLALTGRRDLGPAIKDVIEVAVTDTTGCGDGFTAGLLAGLLAGAAPEDAAWLGLACGALVATGLGSDAGIENLGQVLNFLEVAQPAVAGRIKEHIK